MPFALAVFATFYLLVLRSEVIAPFRAAIAGGALSLLHIEGLAWAVLIAVVSFVSRRMKGDKDWRPLALYLAIVGGVFSIYFGWRYSYYELLFHNPVYAKVGFGPAGAVRGFQYVATFVLTFLTPILILPAAYVAWRRGPKPLATAVVTMAMAFPAYGVVVGGD